MSEFSMAEREASQLFGSAAHLLAAPQLIGEQLDKLADRNKDTFSPEQAESLMQMLVKVAAANGSVSPTQQEFIDSVRSAYIKTPQGEGTWA